MRKRKLVLGAASVGFGLFNVPCANAETHITVTPRYWNFFDNSTRQSANIAETTNDVLAGLESDPDLAAVINSSEIISASGAINGKNINIGLAGASITIENSQLANWNFTISALAGSDTYSSTVVTSAIIDLTTDFGTFRSSSSGETATTVNSDRVDVELTIQRRFESNPQLSMLGGIRYEGIDQTVHGVGTAYSSIVLQDDLFPAGEVTETDFSSKAKVSWDTWSARIGAAAYVPISERQLAYASAQGFIGQTKQSTNGVTTTYLDETIPEQTSAAMSENVWTAGPDITIGYVINLTENVSLDARYRGLFAFPLGNQSDFDDPRVQHGLNVGISLRF